MMGRQVRGTLNSVDLLGWMGGDPELRLTPSGAKVCRFNLATKHPSGQDAQGNRTYETTWTTIEVWDRLADQCNNALHKGSRVMVSGSLRTDSWADRETGQIRNRTYVRASDVIFLDARSGGPDMSSEVASEVEEGVPF